MKEYKKGDLRFWWIPQIPMKAFHYDVKSVDEAIMLYDCLARYDMFQYKNNIKPDYSNAGGLEIYEEDGDGNLEWCDYYNENYASLDELVLEKLYDKED